MASKVLLIHNSGSESSADSEDDEPPNKRTKQSVIWDQGREFATGIEAHDLIKSEKQWRMRSKSITEAGDKVYYDCKVSRSCLAKVYVLVQSNSLKANLYQSTSTHPWGETDERIVSRYKTKVS